MLITISWLITCRSLIKDKVLFYLLNFSTTQRYLHIYHSFHIWEQFTFFSFIALLRISRFLFFYSKFNCTDSKSKHLSPRHFETVQLFTFDWRSQRSHVQSDTLLIFNYRDYLHLIYCFKVVLEFIVKRHDSRVFLEPSVCKGLLGNRVEKDYIQVKG